MRKLGILILLLFSLVQIGHAQNDSCNFSVTGKILDVETKEPIPYVSVGIQGTNKGTVADENGKFLIDGLCSNSNTLIISCFGYCDSICEHNHQHGKVPHIYLKQDVIEVDEVTIKAQVSKEEGTASMSQITINKEELKSNPTQTLANAVADQAGVEMISTGSNIQIPVIHGLYGNRILILNNGLKHGFQNWGQSHAPEIDVASANNITVIKGASGVRFGPEALGGAIIINPNPLYLKEPFYIDASTGYQTNGRGYNAGFETGQGGKNWSYFLNGNYTRIGDRHAPNYSLTNTGKEEFSTGAGARYHTEKFDAKVYYSLVDQNLAVLRASFAHSGDAIASAFQAEQPDEEYTLPFSFDINEPNHETQHHLGKAEFKWRYSDHGNLTYRYGRQLNTRQEYDVRRNSELPIINLSLTTTDQQLEWKHPDWFKLDGLIGVQYFYQDNDNIPGTNTTPFIPNYNTYRYSAFIIESKRVGDDMFEAGIRVDNETNNVRGRETNQDIFRDEFSFNNATASLGYVRNFSKSGSFRTNIGSAWRTPNMAELYSFGQHGYKTSFGLLRYYYNDEGDLRTNQVLTLNEAEIQPEKGYKFTNELQLETKKVAHTITAYSHYIENFIFQRPFKVIGTFRGPQPVFIFDQTDAFFVGGDYTMESVFTKYIKGTFGINYLWSRDVSKNQVLINQPPITANYKLAWKQKKLRMFKSSKVILKPMYRFKQFQAPRTATPRQLIDGEIEIDENSEIFDFKEAPEGYFRFDLAWQFEIKQFKGSIAVNNLFNSTYRDYLNEMRYFADAPGRNILLNLAYRFKYNNKPE